FQPVSAAEQIRDLTLRFRHARRIDRLSRDDQVLLELRVHPERSAPRNEHQVVLTLAEKAPFLVQDADHPKPPGIDPDVVSQQLLVGAELLQRLAPQQTDVMRLVDIQSGERSPDSDL